MSGTRLSQIVWGVFLAHKCLPKVAKIVIKSQKSISDKLLYELSCQPKLVENKVRELKC